MRCWSWQSILVGGLCSTLALSIASAQSTQPAGGLKGQTTAVHSSSGLPGAHFTAKTAGRAPLAERKPVLPAPGGTIPANIPEGVVTNSKVDPELSSPASAVTGTIAPDKEGSLGSDFEYVPMPGGDGATRVTKGGYKTTTIYQKSTPAQPVVRVNIDKERPIDPEPRKKPKVWAIPFGTVVSPTTGNMLADGFLQYDRGPQRTGHRFANAIWNSKDKKVRMSVDANRGIQFQVVAELEGKQRRLAFKADDLIGPRPLPAEKCVTFSRVWYTRGQNGREPDSWWDHPATLVPIHKPLLVPSEDNPVPGQTNQGFVVTIYIPKLVLSGVYKTTLHVSDLDDPTYYENIDVEISAQPDGTRMRSVIG